MSEAMREAFEAHYFSCHGGGNMTFDHANSYYLDSDVNDYWLAFQAGEQTALSANGGACPSCNGSGTTEVLSDNSPDAYGVDVDCPDCSGTGANAEDDGWHGKPVCPGRYEVRGFDHFGTVGVVSVAVEGGELVCNLHDSSTAEIDEYSYYLSDIDEDFEWRTLYTHPAPPSVAVPEGTESALSFIKQALALPSKPLPDPHAHSHEAYARALHEAFCAIRFKLMHAMDALTAAPSPDHIADAGKVVPSDWEGWACHKAGKMPRLYGEKSIAEVNCDTENGERLVFLSSTPSVPENEIKAQTLEWFADWLKRQSFAHKKRWTSAANEALRCAARLRQSSDGDDSEGVE